MAGIEMSREQKIVSKLIALMAQVEAICEAHRLLPPVEITARDRQGRLFNFDYDPEWDSVELLHVAPEPPITVRLGDANGTVVEVEITDFAVRPEWMKRSLQ
ncbi:MAG TPA: hypothetical protein VFV92_03990 [Candidatus Bathyarchaeia archaeon]|nr:hypothetical protein [Candidatus Bathyarchaeia archaeon]